MTDEERTVQLLRTVDSLVIITIALCLLTSAEEAAIFILFSRLSKAGIL